MPLTSYFNYLNNSNEIDVINNFDLYWHDLSQVYKQKHTIYPEQKRFYKLVQEAFISLLLCVQGLQNVVISSFLSMYFP